MFKYIFYLLLFCLPLFSIESLEIFAPHGPLDQNLSFISNLKLELSLHEDLYLIFGGFIAIFGTLIYLTIKLNRSKKELEEKELFLNTVLDSQEHIIITTNGRKILSANISFLAFFRVYNLNVFRRQHNCICDTFAKDSPEGYLQPIMNGVDWLTHILTYRNITHKAIIERDGKRYTFKVSAITLPNSDKLKSVTFTDITELVEKSDEVERQFQFIEELMNTAPLPIFYQNRDFKFKFVNQHFISLLAKNRDIVGKSVFQLNIEKRDAETLHQDDLRLSESYSKYSTFETELNTNSGKRSLVFSKRRLGSKKRGFLGIVGAIQDITEAKNREKRLIEYKQHVSSSIKFASLLQETTLPNNSLFTDNFNDHFIIWEPKDTVGGDIYFFEKLNRDESLLFVIDCTGHGVSGAFITMIVKTLTQQLLYDINSGKIASSNTSGIFNYFNEEIKKLLNQYSKYSISNAGFDGAVIYINRESNILKFSGAEVPLFYIENGQVEVIKGDRQSIGYKHSKSDFSFKSHTLNVYSGLKIYVTTDGFIDQNGGDSGFPFGKKRLKRLIEEYYYKPFREQKMIYSDALEFYQKSGDRNDDITFIGLEF